MKSELFRFLPRPKECLKNQNEKETSKKLNTSISSQPTFHQARLPPPIAEDWHERVYVINIARLRPEIKYLS